MAESRYRRTHLGQKALHPATQMISYGYDPSLSEGAVKPPVFLTSTFAFPSAEDAAEHFDRIAGRAGAGAQANLVYSRFNHPNLQIIEDRLALLDGTEAAVVTASGMAAIATTMFALLEPGDVVLHSTPLYGGTDTLFHRQLSSWGIEVRRLPLELTAATWKQSLLDARNGRRAPLIYIETPANPTNEMLDLELLNTVIDEVFPPRPSRPIVVCDNTLLGPLFQQPARFGIDLCVYSLTKYVGGHSDLVAGGVTGRRDLIDAIRTMRSAIGSQLDPHTCWLIGRSMETLALRMTRAAESALVIADWLAKKAPIPCRVRHPAHDVSNESKRLFAAQASGHGSTFAFEMAAGRETAFRILNALRLFKLAVSLGGSESLACHPASTTHSGVPASEREVSGVSDGLVRISIGLEEPSDLIADLDQAFRAALR